MIKINIYPQAIIERLPVEILQEIFLLTQLDLNLPRASPVISQKLRNRYVLSLICDQAFQPNVSQNRTVNYRERQDRWVLQKRVFDLKWMTWDFFSWYLERWQHRTASRHGSTLSPILVPAGPEHRPLRGRMRMYSRGVPNIICPLPNKLLRGPFTPDKLSFLRCLLDISNASVDWADKQSVRISTLAKHDAILERNLDAVHLLSRARRLAKAPNLELVKFAVIEGGCDRSIVLELMTAAREWGHRRWADVELDAWVVQEAAKGSQKARWLKIKLDDLRYGNFPDPKTGDYVGDRLVVKGRGERWQSTPTY